jgi:hypothetical protein
MNRKAAESFTKMNRQAVESFTKMNRKVPESFTKLDRKFTDSVTKMSLRSLAQPGAQPRTPNMNDMNIIREQLENELKVTELKIKHMETEIEMATLMRRGRELRNLMRETDTSDTNNFSDPPRTAIRRIPAETPLASWTPLQRDDIPVESPLLVQVKPTNAAAGLLTNLVTAPTERNEMPKPEVIAFSRSTDYHQFAHSFDTNMQQIQQIQPNNPRVVSAATLAQEKKVCLKVDPVTVIGNDANIDTHDTIGSPEKHSTIGSPENHNTIDSPEEEDTIGSPEERDTIGSPKDHNPIDSPEDHDTIDSPEDHDTIDSPEDHDTIGSPEDHDTIDSPQDHDTIGFPQKHDMKAVHMGLKGDPELRDTCGTKITSSADQVCEVLDCAAESNGKMVMRGLPESEHGSDADHTSDSTMAREWSVQDAILGFYHKHKKKPFSGNETNSTSGKTESNVLLRGWNQRMIHYDPIDLTAVSDVTDLTVMSDVVTLTVMSDVVTGLTVMSDDARDLTLMSDDATDLTVVSYDTTDLKAVSDSPTDLTVVSNDTTDLDAVSDSPTDLTVVNDDVTDLTVMSNDAADLNTVSDDVTDLNKVSDDATDLNTVSDDTTDLTAVSDDATDLTAVSDDATDLTAVSDDATDPTVVSNDATGLTAVIEDSRDLGAVSPRKPLMFKTNHHVNNSRRLSRRV